MLIDKLIEKAFSDGYEYALMEQREYAYLDGMVGTGVSSSGLLAKKSLAPRSPKAAERAKVSVSSPKISRPAPYPRQAQRAAGNPFSKASQFLSGPGGLR